MVIQICASPACQGNAHRVDGVAAARLTCLRRCLSNYSTQIIGGKLCTRYGGAAVLIAAVLSWSICTILTPVAASTSMPALILCRVSSYNYSGATQYTPSPTLNGRARARTPTYPHILLPGRARAPPLSFAHTHTHTLSRTLSLSLAYSRLYRYTPASFL